MFCAGWLAGGLVGCRPRPSIGPPSLCRNRVAKHAEKAEETQSEIRALEADMAALELQQQVRGA